MIRRLTMTLTPLALSLGLAGCLNLAPDYQRPALPVPATLPAASALRRRPCRAGASWCVTSACARWSTVRWPRAATCGWRC
jgi:hypothetical protein